MNELESGALGRAKFRADFDLNEPRTNELEVDPATDCGLSGGIITAGAGPLAVGGGICVLSIFSTALRARSSCNSFCLRSVVSTGSLSVVCCLVGGNAGSSGTSRMDERVDSRFSRRAGYSNSF